MLSLSHSKIILALLVGFSLAPVTYASNNNRALVASKRGRRNKWNKVSTSTSNTPEEASQPTTNLALAAKDNTAAGLLEWRRVEALIEHTEGGMKYDELHIQRIKTETEKRTTAIQQKLDERIKKLTAQQELIKQEAQTQIAAIQEQILQRQIIKQEAFAKRMGLLATLATAERALLKHHSPDHQQLATELNIIFSNPENAQILTSARIVRATPSILAESTQANDQIFYGPANQATEPTDAVIVNTPAQQETTPNTASTTPVSTDDQGWLGWIFGSTAAPAAQAPSA